MLLLATASLSAAYSFASVRAPVSPGADSAARAVQTLGGRRETERLPVRTAFFECGQPQRTTAVLRAPMPNMAEADEADDAFSKGFSEELKRRGVDGPEPSDAAGAMPTDEDSKRAGVQLVTEPEPEQEAGDGELGQTRRTATKSRNAAEEYDGYYAPLSNSPDKLRGSDLNELLYPDYMDRAKFNVSPMQVSPRRLSAPPRFRCLEALRRHSTLAPRPPGVRRDLQVGHGAGGHARARPRVVGGGRDRAQL